MKTVNYTFFPCNTARQYLFAVQPGIPGEDALSESSCILSTVVSLLRGIDDSEEAQAALYLVQMAKAAIDSVVAAS